MQDTNLAQTEGDCAKAPAELTEGELGQVIGAGLPLIKVPVDARKCPTAVE